MELNLLCDSISILIFEYTEEDFRVNYLQIICRQLSVHCFSFFSNAARYINAMTYIIKEFSTSSMSCHHGKGRTT